MRARRPLIALLSAIACLPACAGGSPLPGTDRPVPEQWLAAWARVQDTPAAYVNRLVLSESAYLRQHADNPIDWHPWGEAALARAGRENKLIFLSIGYASCHWCHVMERESFVDPEVAALLNRGFVAIKVDREEHPDIDRYYSLAAELVRGEAGWPVSAILEPGGDVFLVYAYLSKRELMSILQRSGDTWRNNPDWVRDSARLITAQLTRRLAAQPRGAGRFDADWPQQAGAALLALIDPEHGGFGTAEKFPSELRLQFLLNRYKLDPDPALAQVLRSQLDRIVYSGLHDVVNGGVFRYATDRAMRRPHFEKMLYNQALTASLFADAHAWLGEPAYLEFARGIASFVGRHMATDRGLYVAATDADHRGVEGGYYLWPAAQLEPVPEGLATASFGAERHFLLPKSAAGVRSDLPERLRAQRKERPRRAENVITAWNALWAQALLDLGDGRAAAALGEALWDHAWRAGRLYRLGSQPGYLDDYSYLASVYWNLYLATGEVAWKERAGQLTSAILQRFHADGALFYQAAGAAAPARLESWHDQVLPSAAAVALDLFRRQETHAAFLEVTGRLEARAYAGIGQRPSDFLTLVTLGGPRTPAQGRVIARGKGVVNLLPRADAGAWAFEVRLDPGWHINASEVLDEYLIPTRISAADGQAELQVAYPPGVVKNTEFSEQPLLLYEGRLAIPIGADRAIPRLDVRVRLQACSDELCLPPENFRLVAVRQ